MKRYSTIIKSLFVLLAAFGLSFGVAKGQGSKFAFFDDIAFGSVYGLSDNGRYAVITQGLSDYDMIGYFYDKVTGELVVLGNCSVIDVSDDGLVAGRFLDKSLKVNGQAIYSGGWWKDGEWHSLGLHPKFGIEEGSRSGSSSGAITPDGRIIAGYSFVTNKKLVPCTWNLETGEFIEFKTEVSDQNGGRPHGLSDDGLSMCGWSYMVDDIYIGTWLPTWWKDKNTTITVPKEALIGSGFLRAMNSAGTSVGGYLGGDGLYMPEYGATSFLGYDKWRGMSDPDARYKKGIMVGQYGSFWTEENGVMSFDEYIIDVWGVDIDWSQHVGFGIQSITDDGRTIAGGCYTSTMTPIPFILTLEGYPLPVAVKSVSTLLTEGTTNVKVTWERPIYNGYPIRGWNVYRNGVKLNDKLLEGAMEFVDTAAPLGVNAYYVTAEYSFDETIKESPAGQTSYIEVIEAGACFSPKDLVANIVYNKTVNLNWSLPKANYGDNNGSSNNTSTVKGYNLFRDGVKLNIALLTERSYSEVIIVPGSESVEYNYEVNAEFENGCESAKSMATKITIDPIGVCTSVKNLRVEALRGSAIVRWNKPNSPSSGVVAVGYNIYRNGVKINDGLIKDLTYTDSNLELGIYEYQIDVFFSNSCESPKSDPVTMELKDFNPVLPANNVNLTTSAGNKANLTWDVPELGDYKTMRWFNGAIEGLNGRVEGGDLWVACLWDARDLDDYFDYTLTDIEFYSAYNIPHTFYVYVDGELRATQVLNSVNANEFNVAQLDVPVLVERGKTLKVAYKITHGSGNWVIGSDRQKAIEGKGNLMSEDGVNWYNASIEGMVGNWAMTVRLSPYSVGEMAKRVISPADLVSMVLGEDDCLVVNDSYVENAGLSMSPNAVASEKSSMFANKEVVGYNIYRNDVQINEATITDTKYSDVMVTGVNNCYKVEALFTNDRKAPKSESVCSYGDCLVPQNLEGEAIGVEGAFKLNWDVPMKGNQEVVLRQHSGENSQAVGFPEKLKYYAVSKWTPFDMFELGNCVLKAVEVYVHEKGDISIVAFQGGELILQQKMTSVEEGEFNMVVIEGDGIQINTGKELMVGVYVNALANAMNIGMDEGPVVRDRGDLISFNGKDFNAICQMSAISANWNITAILEDSGDSKGMDNNAMAIELPEFDNVDLLANLEIVSLNSNTKKSSMYNATELLVGYNVYRDGEKLNKSYISTNEYIDAAGLDENSHEYKVTAFWNTGCESAFSNVVKTNPVSVDNIEKGCLSVYPNPSNGVINVVGEYDVINIYNVSGKRMMEVSDKSNSINISALNDGVYFVEAVDASGNVYRTKVIVRK